MDNATDQSEEGYNIDAYMNLDALKAHRRWRDSFGVL